jgi:RNA polymerase sigma-70 factor, ECF subfamily
MMTDHEQLRDEQKYRRYLLGQCSPQESDDVEQAIVVESDVSDLVGVIEDELTEDYVKGDLNDGDRISFERQFLSNPEGRRKIRLSAVLLNRLDVAEKLNARHTEATLASQTQSIPSGSGTEGTPPMPSVAAGTSSMRFYAFDHAYVDRLSSGDFRTEAHFVAFFSELIQLKLRARLRTPQAIEDVREETFARVFAALRSPGGIPQPDRLGAFVNSICNSVLLEHYRASSRDSSLEAEPEQNFPDPVIDVLGAVAAKQMEAKVLEILEGLPERDRRLIRAVYLEERDKDEVCREFGVDRNYLRVLLHRAKQSFKNLYLKMPTRNRA